MLYYLFKPNLLSIIILSSFLPFFPAKAEYLPEQRPGWCKNEVTARYNTFMADVSIININGNEVIWRIESTGRTGKCMFNQQNQFIRITVDDAEEHYRATRAIYWNNDVNQWIAPDGGICHTCTPDNGFPIPPLVQDGFFYLPNEKLWYDPDGHVCNTCTPANGFPVN